MQSPKIPGMAIHAAFILWCLYCKSASGSAGHGSVITTSKQWRSLIYEHMQHGDACVRILNSTGQVGCSAPAGVSELHGDLVPWDTEYSKLPVGSILVVPPDQLSPLLASLRSDGEKRKRVAAVVVMQGRPSSFSPSSAFPRASTALYSNPEYTWNPHGTALSFMDIGLPVFQMDNTTSQSASERAQWNALQGFTGRQHAAKMKLSMTATNHSAACLPQRHCLPLGGHSVWAAWPPFPLEGTVEHKVVLVTAGVDSSSLFHEMAKGADDPLSGLIVMLVALDMMRNATSGDDLRRHLVFSALLGESWDNQGSKRMMWEMNSSSNSTWGWNMEQVEQVIEIGAVGLSQRETGSAQLYMHYQRGEQYKKPSVVMDALVAAANSTTQVLLAECSNSTPGLPPSSLPSFLRVKPGLMAVHLAEYDNTFINTFYHSRFDDERNIDSAALASAAELVGRTLYSIAGAGTAEQMPVDRTNVLHMVEGLIHCLIEEHGGLGCWLAGGMFDPSETLPLHHYTSVLETLTGDDQDPRPNVKKPLERFLWGFMAQRTQMGEGELETGSAAGPCDFVSNKCSAASVCTGHNYTSPRKGPTGTCVRATVRYVPSYSTRFACIGCRGNEGFGNWSVVEDSVEWEAAGSWPEDAMWTESMWPLGVPSLTLYLRESGDVERVVLMAGIAVTAVALLSAVTARSLVEWRKKTQ